MALWLFKEEPEQYAYADLERDRSTIWEGVTNNLALQNLRKVRKGDKVFYYHTGKEKAVVGVMKACSDPTPDPSEANAKLVVVEVEPVRRLARAVTLGEIKQDPILAEWELVRLPRLSVMPVSEEQWRRIEEMSRSQGRAGP